MKPSRIERRRAAQRTRAGTRCVVQSSARATISLSWRERERIVSRASDVVRGPSYSLGGTDSKEVSQRSSPLLSARSGNQRASRTCNVHARDASGGAQQRLPADVLDARRTAPSAASPTTREPPSTGRSHRRLTAWSHRRAPSGRQGEAPPPPCYGPGHGERRRRHRRGGAERPPRPRAPDRRRLRPRPAADPAHRARAARHHPRHARRSAPGSTSRRSARGGGHVLRMFPRARITAIDVSDAFLGTARKNLAGYDARFLKGEVDKLDLPRRELRSHRLHRGPGAHRGSRRRPRGPSRASCAPAAWPRSRCRTTRSSRRAEGASSAARLSAISRGIASSGAATPTTCTSGPPTSSAASSTAISRVTERRGGAARRAADPRVLPLRPPLTAPARAERPKRPARRSPCCGVSFKAR